MNIIVFCNAGLSSGLIVNKMRNVAEPGDTINAYQSSKFQEMAPTADVVFLSPALRFQVNTVKKICDPLGIPVRSIDTKIYGFADGAVLYNEAKKILAEKNK